MAMVETLAETANATAKMKIAQSRLNSFTGLTRNGQLDLERADFEPPLTTASTFQLVIAERNDKEASAPDDGDRQLLGIVCRGSVYVASMSATREMISGQQGRFRKGICIVFKSRSLCFFFLKTLDAATRRRCDFSMIASDSTGGWALSRLVDWRSDGLVVWWNGGLVVWWIGGLVVWWFGGCVNRIA